MFIRDRFKSYGSNFKFSKLGGLVYLWDIGNFLLNINAKTRMKHKFFSFGYEWLLFGKIAEKYFKVV